MRFTSAAPPAQPRRDRRAFQGVAGGVGYHVQLLTASPPMKRAVRSQPADANRKLGDPGLTSIYDLAEKTGFSTSTVSRVLNQRGRISEDTRRRVLAAARAAGFRPRASVRRDTAALVFDRMGYAGCGGFLTGMLSHLVAAMARHEIAAEIYTEDNAEQLGTRFVDGVIALTWDPSTIELLRGMGEVPIVMVNRGDIDDVSVAMTAHREGGREVAEYMLERGHRRLGMIAEEHDWGAAERIIGMSDALRRRGLDADSHLFTAFTNHHSLQRGLHHVLDRGVTALFLAGEDLTVPGMHMISASFGRRIGEDLSVIGMENEQVSRYTIPPLTSLAQPMADLASAALELLVDAMESRSDKPRRRVLQNRMLERGSVSILDVTAEP